ncbi:MAG: threonine synthase [Alphaproteobacteria bacterium]
MNYISTRNNHNISDNNFSKITMEGLAPDGGLYIPDNFPYLTSEEINNMVNLSYAELFTEIIYKFCGSCVKKSEIYKIAEDAYKDFGSGDLAPLTNYNNNIKILELYHGPTLAFKDFALQFLSRIFNLFLERSNKNITIIGATSGDTGSAAIEAFKNNPRANIIILHPKGKVSEFQRRQMTTIKANNVFNIALEGNFDDCQAIVKKLLIDKQFNDKHCLASINSINWGRVLAQVVYYFYSTFKVLKNNNEQFINFSVPTGNFGDAYAGYVAKKMGLPINKIIIATNSNDILSKFFKSGIYKVSEVIPTLSPSMDIQVASNFERLLFECLDFNSALVTQYMTNLNTHGSFEISKEILYELNKTFVGASVSDDITIERIRSCFSEKNIIIDPHTSVGLEAACSANLEGLSIVLSTAHPVKFSSAVNKAIDNKPSLPNKYKNIFSLTEKYQSMPNDLNEIKSFISTNSSL